MIVGGSPDRYDTEIVDISPSGQLCPKPSDNGFGGFGMVGAYINNVATVCGGHDGSSQDHCSHLSSFMSVTWVQVPKSISRK